MTDSERAERLARNEARWRELNAELERGLSAIDRDADERAAFVCECGRPDCTEIVKLPLDAYQRAHEKDEHFVIRPGHEFPDVERVIEEAEGYFVVEKRHIGRVPEIVDREEP
jgi:hypothetical protein